MATTPDIKGSKSKVTGKMVRTRRNKAGLPKEAMKDAITFKVKPEDNVLVPLMADQLRQGKEITLEAGDRLSLYIHYYLTPKEDGTRRTKKEAAMLAGYAEETAENITCGAERSVGFSRKLADYVNAWPRGDIRCDCVSVAQSILQDADKPGERLAAARYLTEILGEYAPKRTETATISLRGKLPARG